MQLRLTQHATIKTWQESCTPGACGDMLLMTRSDEATRLLVTDACGHGPKAARLSRLFAGIVWADLRRPLTQATFLGWNRQLIEGSPFLSRFVAVTVIELDHDDGAVRIWNAGNPAPIWIHGTSGRLDPVEVYGMPLGICAPPKYEPPSPGCVQPEEDDVLLAFSDGLTDLLVGRERIAKEQLRSALADSVQRGTDPLEDLRSTFGESQPASALTDDLTVVEVAWPSESAATSRVSAAVA